MIKNYQNKFKVYRNYIILRKDNTNYDNGLMWEDKVTYVYFYEDDKIDATI